MTELSCQFYAVPEELLSLSVNAVFDFSLHVVALRYPPFDAVEINSELLPQAVIGSQPAQELAFTLSSPVLPARGRMDFIDENPTYLSLQIGTQTADGLEESSISASANDDTALAVWKAISHRLRKQTKQGITAINRQTGMRSFHKAIRYTEGAKKLEATGVEMLPFGGRGPKGPRIVLGRAATV